MEFEYLQEVSEMDKRLTNRMIKTLQTLSANIRSSIIASVQNVYEAKAIYRMLSNKGNLHKLDNVLLLKREKMVF